MKVPGVIGISLKSSLRPLIAGLKRDLVLDNLGVIGSPDIDTIRLYFFLEHASRE